MDESSDKQCNPKSGCGETKPRSEFDRMSRNKDGLSGVCVPCARAKSRERYERKKGKADGFDADTLTRECADCGEAKLLREFYKHPGGKYGRLSQCVPCVKSNVSKYHAANRDTRAAFHRAYRAKHEDELREYIREWHVRNPGKSSEYGANRRALLEDAFVEAVNYESLRESYNDCYLCGVALSGVVHMDHVVPLVLGGAHCYDNMRPTHMDCNLRKKDKPLSALTWYKGPTDLGLSLEAWACRP